MAKKPPNQYRHNTPLATAIANVQYIIKADHRDGGNGYKSQWVIPEPSEVRCFEQSHQSKWIDNNTAWGLHLPAPPPQVLGRSVEGADLRIARFISAANGAIWHGFPADYRRKMQDRPTNTILVLWMRAGYIRKRDISKVRS